MTKLLKENAFVKKIWKVARILTINEDTNVISLLKLTSLFQFKIDSTKLTCGVDFKQFIKQF